MSFENKKSVYFNLKREYVTDICNNDSFKKFDISNML